MSLRLRIASPGAPYHVTSRGDRRESIFEDDEDQQRLLAVVAGALERFEGVAFAYCLMGNHYHFVLRTHRPNLSQVMRQVNGVYTQSFNRRHGKVGHVFQGRFKAVLVDEEAYLMAVCRYVEWNPVRAGMVPGVLDWPWSSAQQHLGLAPAEPWLDSAALFGHLLGRDAVLPSDWHEARSKYATLVQQENAPPLWANLRQQIYLGDEAFVTRMQSRGDHGMTHDGHVPSNPQASAGPSSREIPLAQRRPARTVEQWLRSEGSREQAFWRAHIEGGWSLTAIGHAAGLSVSQVSRIVARVRSKVGHA